MNFIQNHFERTSLFLSDDNCIMNTNLQKIFIHRMLLLKVLITSCQQKGFHFLHAVTQLEKAKPYTKHQQTATIHQQKYQGNSRRATFSWLQISEYNCTPAVVKDNVVLCESILQCASATAAMHMEALSQGKPLDKCDQQPFERAVPRRTCCHTDPA